MPLDQLAVLTKIALTITFKQFPVQVNVLTGLSTNLVSSFPSGAADAIHFR